MTTAWRRWPTSHAWARPSRSSGPRSTRWPGRASTTCSPSAGTPAGQEEWKKTEGGLEYSRELVELIAADYPFAIGAACFPETHIHAASPEEDLEHLVEKVDAGVDFLVTNLFFDNAAYFDFLDRARAAGIAVPIIPGIMPITKVGQIERMAKMSGAAIPEGLRRELHARGDDGEAVLDFGVAYATLAVRRAARRRRARDPLLHAQPLPATRAILSALKLTRPWERAVYPGSISSASATAASRRPPRSGRRRSRSDGRCRRPRHRAASASR